MDIKDTSPVVWKNAKKEYDLIKAEGFNDPRKYDEMFELADRGMWKCEGTEINSNDLLLVLSGLSQGSITALDGPSGCGKSTLLGELDASEDRSLEKLTVEELREFIMERLRFSPHRVRKLSGADIIDRLAPA